MKIHKNFYVAVAFLIISFVCMLFLTTASPLYSVNPSLDGNTMFTIGKSLWHGLMPYKDLFDQRGPLIYLMNSVAALISYKSFAGIYIFESIAMFLDLFFIFKILNLKYNKKISVIGTFCAIPLIFTSKFLTYGNIPEEYILPLIFITIYMLTCKSVDNWGKYEYILIGLFMSISFWIKYTLSATWVALYLVLLIYSIYHKYWKKLFTSIFYGLVGFVPISLLIIILYSCKNTLYDLFYVYFYLNITSYGKLVSFFFIKSLIFAFIILILFLILYIKIYRLLALNKYILFAITLFNYIVLVRVCADPYYIEIMSFTFLVLPIFICYVLNNYTILNKIIYTVPLLSLLGIFVFNTNFIHYSQLWNATNSYIDASGKNSTPIIRKFASIINKSNNKSILIYRKLDPGIYTYSGLIPKEKFFVMNNMNYKPMKSAQMKYLMLKKEKFVFIEYSKYPTNIYSYRFTKSQINVLKNDYKIVGARNGLFEGNVDRYVLYQRKY